jgi:hypothetical protein
MPPARVVASERALPASAAPERRLGGNASSNTDKFLTAWRQALDADDF